MSSESRVQSPTPVMAQYLRLKAEAGDAILFFRMGDFYEMFFEDAAQAAAILDLTLTSRNKSDPDPIPMAGVPWHSAEPYITKLLEAGRRVAICEQAVAGGKLMDRRIVEILSPGTTVTENFLDGRRNNYLCAILPGEKLHGLAVADVSTGEFMLGDLETEDLRAEFARLMPREIIWPRDAAESPLLAELTAEESGIFRALRDDWEFSPARGRELLLEQFAVATLEPYGVENCGLGLAAAGALLVYAREQRRAPLTHLRPPRALHGGEALVLDEDTRRNLEVLEPLSGRGPHCVLGVVDDTCTALGARALRRALGAPLRDHAAISGRHAAVGCLLDDPESHAALRVALGLVADLERLLGRMHCDRSSARDLARARDSVAALPEILRQCARLDAGGQFPVGRELDPLAPLHETLTRALVDEPSVDPDGDIVRPGYDADLDRLRELGREGRKWIAELQESERAATGIGSLKVGYNKVFGYYLEVTRAHLERVPTRYERRQTLVGAERFVTPELKDWEARILGAREEARARQQEIVNGLIARVRADTAGLQAAAAAVADLDLLQSFASAARRGNYVRPQMDESDTIEIQDGRHPVVERFLSGETFVPNDVTVDTRDRQILVITGPNMAGKSTFLRQVGVLTLLAQAGSYIPAKAARIGIADRIFTRVGASDNIARGQSTFLVEMIETSRILHQATSRSLVLLDEVGRGTSTFDGLAIAWAVAERLREDPLRRPRTLFATHFHELTALARRSDGYQNLNVLVKEWKDRVIFVRRVVPGAADRSYGIQVARLAGLPDSVLARARQILARLERNSGRQADGSDTARDAQLALFASDSDEFEEQPVAAQARDAGGVADSTLAELRAAISALDPDKLTPREALDWLYSWIERLRDSHPGDGRPER